MSLQLMVDTLARMSVSEIEQFFISEGIRGEVESADTCPIAKWMVAKAGTVMALPIFPKLSHWIVVMERDEPGQEPEVIPAPRSLCDFMERFDAGDADPR